MKQMGAWLAAMTAAALGGSCTAPAEPGSASARADGRECFRADDVNSFSPVGDDAVNVRVGPSAYYRLELTGPCPDIDWSQRVAIRTRGTGWVCRGYDADLLVPGPLGAQTCPVRAVRRLSEEEVEAFRADRR